MLSLLKDGLAKPNAIFSEISRPDSLIKRVSIRSIALKENTAKTYRARCFAFASVPILLIRISLCLCF